MCHCSCTLGAFLRATPSFLSVAPPQVCTKDSTQMQSGRQAPIPGIRPLSTEAPCSSTSAGSFLSFVPSQGYKRQYLNARSFLSFVPTHQVCYARILDAKRKFLESALKYYDLSQLDKRSLGDK